MRLRVEQLAKHLQNDLLPVYLVAGDEPLQQDECLDALRASARFRARCLFCHVSSVLHHISNTHVSIRTYT